MTLKEYIDAVKLRLSRIITGIDVNDYKLVMYINNHRKAVQSATLPYLRDRYGDIISRPFINGIRDTNMVSQPYIDKDYAVYVYDLPDNFLDMVTLIIKKEEEDGQLRKREAREVTLQEVYGVVLNNWIPPSFDDPIYAIKRLTGGSIEDQMPDQNKLIVGYGYDETAMGKPEDWDGELQIWYTKVLDNLDYDGDVENILSPDLQQLVILEVVKNVLQEIDPAMDLGMIRRDLQVAYQALEQNYFVEEGMKIQILESEKPEGAI